MGKIGNVMLWVGKIIFFEKSYKLLFFWSKNALKMGENREK